MKNAQIYWKLIYFLSAIFIDFVFKRKIKKRTEKTYSSLSYLFPEKVSKFQTGKSLIVQALSNDFVQYLDWITEHYHQLRAIPYDPRIKKSTIFNSSRIFKWFCSTLGLHNRTLSSTQRHSIWFKNDKDEIHNSMTFPLH